jgi:hypothetical protein
MRSEANWENALEFKYTLTTPMGLCKELNPNIPKWISQFGIGVPSGLNFLDKA